jgi:hypothetical protein
MLYIMPKLLVLLAMALEVKLVKLQRFVKVVGVLEWFVDDCLV